MKINLLNAKPWKLNKRYKVGSLVTFDNGYYFNYTGVRSLVTTLDLNDWIYLGEVEKFKSFAAANASNITGANLNTWKALFDGENNFQVGIADDGTLENGFDVPISDLALLAFSGLDFEYELDEENGTILIKSKSASQVNADWNATEGFAQILNKPTIPSAPGPVSATVSGIVNNAPLQELGGVDKKINGVIIGRGNENIEGNLILGTGLYSVTKGGLTNDNIGNYNISVGIESGTTITTGYWNTLIGQYTGALLTTGVGNTGIGSFGLAGQSLSSFVGKHNTAIGTPSLNRITTGNRNVAIGNGAGSRITTGEDNISIGYSSGSNTTTGKGNIIIGNSVGAIFPGSLSNKLAIHNLLHTTKDATLNPSNFYDTAINLTSDYKTSLISGDFQTRELNINGKFSITPDKIINSDSTFTKNIVAKTDGTFGWEDKISTANIYSTTETKTNGIWTDGKEIYRKFVSITISAGADTSNPFSVSLPGAGEVISFEKCFMKIDGGVRKIPPAIEVGSNNNWSYDIMNGNDLRVIMGTASGVERVVSGVVEYTKPAL